MPSTVGSIPTHFRHSQALVSEAAGHQFRASRLQLLADVIDSATVSPPLAQLALGSLAALDAQVVAAGLGVPDVDVVDFGAIE